MVDREGAALRRPISAEEEIYDYACRQSRWEAQIPVQKVIGRKQHFYRQVLTCQGMN